MGFRLDQHALEIKLAEKLADHRALVVFTGGIAGLLDRQAQGCPPTIKLAGALPQ